MAAFYKYKKRIISRGVKRLQVSRKVFTTKYLLPLNMGESLRKSNLDG